MTQKQNKTIFVEFEKIQNQIEKMVFSVPILKKTITQLNSTKTAKLLTESAQKSKKHVKLIVKDFPRNLKGVRPYVKIQQRNFESWAKDLGWGSASFGKKAKTKRKEKYTRS